MIVVIVGGLLGIHSIDCATIWWSYEIFQMWGYAHARSCIDYNFSADWHKFRRIIDYTCMNVEGCLRCRCSMMRPAVAYAATNIKKSNVDGCNMGSHGQRVYRVTSKTRLLTFAEWSFPLYIYLWNEPWFKGFCHDDNDRIRYKFNGVPSANFLLYTPFSPVNFFVLQLLPAI